MEPDVAKTLDDLNLALELTRAGARASLTELDAADAAIARAREALAGTSDSAEHFGALLATLNHQVSGLVQPGINPDVPPAAAGAGWKRRLTETFATNVAKGAGRQHFQAKGWQFYTGAYPNNHDTSGRGTYDPDLALTVQDGVLSSRFGFKGATAPYVPYGTAMLPLGWAGQLYGRFSVRFRCDTVLGRKLAWLLWPAPPKGWNDGEIDFPEGSAGGNIWAFNHQIGDPAKNQLAKDTGVRMNDWHTATIEWRPERLTFLLDGKVVAEVTDRSRIPSVPCRWVLQNETTLDKTEPIPLSSTGAVQLRWLTVDELVAA